MVARDCHPASLFFLAPNVCLFVGKHAEVNKSLAAEKAAVTHTREQNDVDQRLSEAESSLAEAQQMSDTLQQDMFQLSEQSRQMEERLREAEEGRGLAESKLLEKNGEVSRLITQTALLEGYKRDLLDLKKQLIGSACSNGIDTIRETMELFHGTELLGSTASPGQSAELSAQSWSALVDMYWLTLFCRFSIVEDVHTPDGSRQAGGPL